MTVVLWRNTLRKSILRPATTGGDGRDGASIDQAIATCLLSSVGRLNKLLKETTNICSYFFIQSIQSSFSIVKSVSCFNTLKNEKNISWNFAYKYVSLQNLHMRKTFENTI